MKRYATSRWIMKHFIFPREIVLDSHHVRTRKRRFPWFWITDEESIPLTKIASIKLHKGLIFSDMIIENSGGDYPIKIEGLTNRSALELRAELENLERKVVTEQINPTDGVYLGDNPGTKSRHDDNRVVVHGLDGSGE